MRNVQFVETSAGGTARGQIDDAIGQSEIARLRAFRQPPGKGAAEIGGDGEEMRRVHAGASFAR